MILCPHCEREIEGPHNADACRRKRMSRRRFFGTLFGAIAAPVVAKVALSGEVMGLDALFRTVGAGGNRILTPDVITGEVLKALQANMTFVSRLLERPTPKIGDVLYVRRPSRLRT
jgi:hypothetical protein